MTYEEACNKIEKLFENSKFAVLATANKQGIVSASQMCIVNDGLILYFQTDKNFEKIKNINDNPHVAVNLGAFYFKAQAKIVGHPTDFPIFIEKLKRKHPETFKHYTNLPNEVLIQVELKECKIWGIDNSKDIHNQETIQLLNFQEKTLTQIICDKM